MDMKQVDDTRKSHLKNNDTCSGSEMKWGTQTLTSEKQNTVLVKTAYSA